jgi:hypothetical protein
VEPTHVMVALEEMAEMAEMLAWGAMVGEAAK